MLWEASKTNNILVSGRFGIVFKMGSFCEMPGCKIRKVKNRIKRQLLYFVDEQFIIKK
jgi:hypothetical protein